MLLRKANRYVNAPKNQLKETLLTNKLLQQFIDLVASSSKERGRKAADRSEARVRENSFTEDQKRAAASRLAASAAAAGAAGRPDKPWSALGPLQQRRRLRAGYLHLKQAIDETVGMVSMLGGDGTPAGVDAVLRETMEDGMRRIKDVGQRLRITVAMVPPKFVRQIEQECRRALKAEVRSERMEQWKSLKYETALTEQTFEALRRCFPRGMLPAWRAIEEYAEQSRTQRIAESQLYLTPFVGIQCNVLESVRAFTAEAFMRMEAGFSDGIVAHMKPGERVRVIIVCGTDGFNCKHFLNPLVASYIVCGLLPAHGGARLVDVYGGGRGEARKRNSAGSLGMVDTAVLFARGDSFPNMQSNLSETPAEWNDPAGARARAPGLNAAELRSEVVRWGLPHMVGGKEATKEVNLAMLLKFLDDPNACFSIFCPGTGLKIASNKLTFSAVSALIAGADTALAEGPISSDGADAGKDGADGSLRGDAQEALDEVLRRGDSCEEASCFCTNASEERRDEWSRICARGY